MGLLFDKEFDEILSGQIIALIAGLIAGVFLAFQTDKLLLIPAMLILIPGFLEMRGNIEGSLSSRLSSGLFLKLIKPKLENTEIIKGNIIASFVLSIIISLVLGYIAFIIEYVALGIFYPKIIVIALIAGAISNIIGIIFSVSLTFYLFKKGHDPNNMMGPSITSLGDIISILSLMFVVVFI